MIYSFPLPAAKRLQGGHSFWVKAPLMEVAGGR